MFNVGFLEFVLIVVIGLVFIGPKQIPTVARTIGRLVGEFRRATNEFTGSLTRMEEETHKVVESISMNVEVDKPEDKSKETIPEKSKEKDT